MSFLHSSAFVQSFLLYAIPHFLSKVTRDAVMWLNAFGVLTHHVYFGTNEAAVAAATTTSPEHRERITGGENVYYLSSSAISLMAGTSYYWRVDAEIDPTTPTFHKGDVWSFRTQ